MGRDTVAVWLVVIGNYSLYRMVNGRVVGIHTEKSQFKLESL